MKNCSLSQHGFQDTFGSMLKNKQTSAQPKGWEQFQSVGAEPHAISIPQKLKNLHHLSLLKLQISCDALESVLRFKACGKCKQAFECLKVSPSQEQTIGRRDLEVLWNTGRLLEGKLTKVFSKNKSKNVSIAFMLLKIHTRVSAQREHHSVQQPDNSIHKKVGKAREKMRTESRQSLQKQQNCLMQNQVLKQRRERAKMGRQNFVLKMDRILCENEAFLRNR